MEQLTQVPLKQVQQVTEIPVTQVKSDQITEEQVTPVQVETVVQSPTTSESKASKIMRRVKSVPSLFKQTTVE